MQMLFELIAHYSPEKILKTVNHPRLGYLVFRDLNFRLELRIHLNLKF